MKGPVKRKVKELHFKVAGLSKECAITPTGIAREALMKEVWIREYGGAEEVEEKIREAFGWDDKCEIQFMYANGRFLRPAELKDVENAQEWDVDSVKALMGSGCLYVIKSKSTKMDTGISNKPPDRKTHDEHEVWLCI